MKKSTVKRCAALLLSLVLLALPCAGCGDDDFPPEVEKLPEPAAFDPQEPLTICFDLDGNNESRHYEVDKKSAIPYFTAADVREDAVERFLTAMKEQGGPENVTYEFVEGRGDERDGALTRLRAELMAGDGPDLFITSSKTFSPDMLFKFVGKKMEENMFLPLDRYLETAQFMDTSRMNQAVLTGGQDSHGHQMVIPIRYTFPCTILNQNKLSLPVETDLTVPHSLEEMLSGGDPALTATLAAWGLQSEKIDYLLPDISNLLGKKADYAKEKPAFSQEELNELAEQLVEFREKLSAGEFGEVMEGMYMSDLWEFRSRLVDTGYSGAPVAIVPLYSREGGVTAKIADYALINSNSKNPAGAFWAMDFFISEEQMQTSALHRYCNNRALPIYNELMQQETMLPYYPDRGAKRDPANYIYFDPEDWEAVAAARDCVDSAEFISALDLELDFLLYDLLNADTEAQREKLVSDCYQKLTMLLGES